MAHFLIIDDDPNVLKFLRVVLEADSHQVVTAQTGERGLVLARLQFPDIILLDINLPGKDGLRILRHLKLEPETEIVPVVMITADKSRDSVVGAISAGAVDYISKPFQPARIREKINRVYNKTVMERLESGSLGRVDIERRAGATFFKIDGFVNFATLHQFDHLLTERLLAQIRSDRIIIDLRRPDISREQQGEVVEALAYKFREYDTVIVAGKNFGFLSDRVLPEGMGLVLSEDEALPAG